MITPPDTSRDDHTSERAAPRWCNVDGPAINAGDVSAMPVDRAATLLPTELIDEGEIIILLLRPSVLFIPLSCMGSVMFILIIALSLALAAIKVPWISWTETQAYGLGGALILLRLGWQVLEWLNRVYVLTDRRIIRRMGVLRVSVFETPLRNVQHTTVFARLRERLLGLGSIGFATSGSDVFDAYWVMVRRPFAVHRIVVDAIRRYGGRNGLRD